jgi:hypothetical protein
LLCALVPLTAEGTVPTARLQSLPKAADACEQVDKLEIWMTRRRENYSRVKLAREQFNVLEQAAFGEHCDDFLARNAPDWFAPSRDGMSPLVNNRGRLRPRRCALDCRRQKRSFDFPQKLFPSLNSITQLLHVPLRRSSIVGLGLQPSRELWTATDE